MKVDAPQVSIASQVSERQLEMTEEYTKWLSLTVTEVNREKRGNVRVQERSPLTWIFETLCDWIWQTARVIMDNPVRKLSHRSVERG